MRDLPHVPLSPTEGYARLAAQGWDTIQEALSLTPTDAFVELLEASQRGAREVSDSLEGVVLVDLGGMQFKAHATGAKGGFRWRLEDDDMIIFIGSPKREWTISVRYLSAGLWEHGIARLRERAFEALRPYTRQKEPDCVRVSRADWCFDFYSPQMTADFEPGLSRNVVCHSSGKAHEAGSYDTWARGGRGETLTIGSKAGLQIQLYDKTREIIEASGKTWLYEVWANGLGGWVWEGDTRPRHMWRLECRFASDFLKERNARRPHEVEAALSNLIAEALFTRRLTIPQAGDVNRWRWPLHPIWSMAYEARGVGEMLPIGRKVTGRRKALVDQARKQLSGAIRSATVLAFGDYDQLKARGLAFGAQSDIEHDSDHQKKVVAAQDRYSNVDDAR